jgi:hypothetical protein
MEEVIVEVVHDGVKFSFIARASDYGDLKDQVVFYINENYECMWNEGSEITGYCYIEDEYDYKEVYSMMESMTHI